MAPLDDRYGAEETLVRVLAMLSADCGLRDLERHAGRWNPKWQCGAMFVDLSSGPPHDLTPASGLVTPKLRLAKG